MRSWDVSVPIQENSSWMRETGGRGRAREAEQEGESMPSSEEKSFRKTGCDREREQVNEKERRREGGVDGFIAAGSIKSA